MRHKILVLLLLSVLAPTAAAAVDAVNQSLLGSVAVEGADPVAYFTERRHVEGSSEHTVEWNGAVWRFSSAQNRDTFEADPEAYAPQYGGYCAYAVSQGVTAGIDPEAWKIFDGKLYLNLNKKIQARWEQDIPGYIMKADERWPTILAK